MKNVWVRCGMRSILEEEDSENLITKQCNKTFKNAVFKKIYIRYKMT